MTTHNNSIQGRISRRRFLGSSGALITGAMLPNVGHAAEELNILVWCDHADRNLLQPFEQTHGVTINVKTYEGTGTALSILQQSAPGDWDVLVVDAPDVPKVAKLGVLMELPDSIAPWEDMFDELRNAPYTHVDGKVYAIPEKFGYYGFCFNRNKVDEADCRRGDVAWNEKYKGRIAVYDYYFPLIQMIGIEMGLKPAEVTEDVLPKIRERLLAMKPNVKMIGDIVSVQNALVTNSVDIIYGGAEFTVSNLIPDNPRLDWTISDQGGLIWNQGIGVLASSRKKELAQEFVKWILSPRGQGLLATSECFWAMPTNSKAELDADAKRVLRWDQQRDFLARSEVSVLPDPALDAAMLDLWTEFLQA